jgi:hypothetical protein
MDTPEPQQQADNKYGETEEQISPGVAKLDVPVTPSDSGTRDDSKKHWIDYAKFGLEVCGFTVLCVYAYFTIRIYYANNNAADAATSAAKTAATTLESFERGQRAFMSVKRINVLGIANAGVTRVNIVWENNGSTAAPKAIQNYRMRVAKSRLPRDFKFPDYKEGAIIPSTIVGAKAEDSSGIMQCATTEVLLVTSGQRHINIWGWIAYDDIFPNSAPHMTEYCFELTEIIGVLDDPNIMPHLTWITCKSPSHTCADEQCTDYAQKTALLKR